MVPTRFDTPPERGNGADLTDSELYALLASDRRRAVMAVVENRCRSLGLEQLAANVAEALEGEEFDPGALRSLAIELHHVHLPKLSDAGLLDYDPAANWVDTDPSG
ncbi:DUF7344 domain-containing protein [Halobaculum lipolyticum]|uniref:DUF7344 domain-containing protein n=1 Tax=Halobaculum lipolyticum TaxID=3032001 RepID=A0ABD5W882_9EURY|nr:hypothetical protein [Halobaculum sp. DT31]